VRYAIIIAVNASQLSDSIERHDRNIINKVHLDAA